MEYVSLAGSSAVAASVSSSSSSSDSTDPSPPLYTSSLAPTPTPSTYKLSRSPTYSSTISVTAEPLQRSHSLSAYSQAPLFSISAVQPLTANVDDIGGRVSFPASERERGGQGRGRRQAFTNLSSNSLGGSPEASRSASTSLTQTNDMMVNQLEAKVVIRKSLRIYFVQLGTRLSDCTKFYGHSGVSRCGQNIHYTSLHVRAF